jgi:enamine deaminase RidA (YjgF/YER057c/UK114 family)
MTMQILQPPGWPRPKGYANGVAASGRMVFVSGMVGWNAEGVFESDDFAVQVRQALANAVDVLAEAGARPEHIVRMTWYVVDRDEYLAAQQAIGAAYRAVIGRHYPAMSAVAVAGLMEARARVEIEVTAVVP